MYVKAGNFIDFGAQADSAATTDTGTFSYMALVKRSLQKLTSLVTNTNAFTSLGTDQAGTMIKVSLYGTNAAAGDTAFPINPSGNVKTNISGVSGGVTFAVQQADVTSSGSITAAQSTQDTPVANATIALTLGKGQTSWAVDLRGTFNAGTTINFDGTLNGMNWFSINGVPVSNTSDAEVSSVVGGSPVQYQGNATGLQQVRVRASVLAGGDSVTVTLIGSVAPDGGFLTKALPAGSASIGAVTQGGTWTVQPGNTANTTAWKVDASSVTVPVSGTFWQATQPVSGTVTVNAGTGNFNPASVGTDGSAIPTSSTLVGASDGTNLQQLLVESATNRNLRTGVYNGANELGIDGGGRVTGVVQVVAGTALAADQTNSELRISNYVTKTVAGDTALTLGSATSANSLPVVVASDQAAFAVKLSGGDNTAIASGAYTTTQTWSDQTNTAARGVRVTLDVTSAGTGSVTLEIDAKDGASGKYIAQLTGVAVTSNSTTVYVVYPGLTPAANSIASDVLPRTWRIKVVANNSNSCTYSVGASYLL